MSDVSLSRQPVFEMAYQQEQSRLTTFFRLFTALPGLLLLGLWSIALWITVPVSCESAVATMPEASGLSMCRAPPVLLTPNSPRSRSSITMELPLIVPTPMNQAGPEPSGR